MVSTLGILCIEPSHLYRCGPQYTPPRSKIACIKSHLHLNIYTWIYNHSMFLLFHFYLWGRYQIGENEMQIQTWTINSFNLQTLIFHPTKLSYVWILLGLPKWMLQSLYTVGWGHNEQMAWMWSTHDHTPFIHNTLEASSLAPICFVNF